MPGLVDYLWVALASLFVIMVASGYAIRAISNYCKKTGIPEQVAGLMIVSLGASLPELFTSIMASIADQGQLILGDVIGANIMNLTITFGIILIIGRKIIAKKEESIYSEKKWIILFLAALPLILGLDGAFSRIDGLVMISSFIMYMSMAWMERSHSGKILVKNVSFKDIWADMFVFTGCLVALLMSARWFVFSSTNLSVLLGIPMFFMGLIFIAIATTVPDLIVNIRSLMLGLGDMAFGEIIGSIIVNLSLVLGVGSLIRPILFDISGFMITAGFMFFALVVGMFFLGRKSMSWKNGIFLILIYLAFLITEIILTYF